jgi:hypothetical protein
MANVLALQKLNVVGNSEANVVADSYQSYTCGGGRSCTSNGCPPVEEEI